MGVMYVLLLCWGHYSCIIVVVRGVKCEVQDFSETVSMLLIESKEGFELKVILFIEGVQGH